MFFSDEPGYYEEGAYGIRLESIVHVVRMQFEDNPDESPLARLTNNIL